MMKKATCKWALLAALPLMTCQLAVAQTWTTLLSEDFSDPSVNGWSYTGPSGGDMFTASGGVLQCQWDQSNGFDDSGDPYVITPAIYSCSLGTTLTDFDSFRVTATLNLASIADTTEFFQLANFGLYNLSQTGADRCMSDNYSGNTTLVKDACDFVEFNYFISSDWSGRNIAATMGAHMDGVDGDYVSGSSSDTMWHDCYMGTNQLPTDQDLYVEIMYDADLRREKVAIYTDEDCTSLLVVDGKEQYYWSQALRDDQHFSLTDVAFLNYVGSNWGGVNGTGSGIYDDLTVQVTPEPASLTLLAVGGIGMLIRRRNRK